jgi:hypothetical protein
VWWAKGCKDKLIRKKEKINNQKERNKAQRERKVLCLNVKRSLPYTPHKCLWQKKPTK